MPTSPWEQLTWGTNRWQMKPQEIHARKIPIRAPKNMEGNGKMELKGLKHLVKESELNYLIRVSN